MEGMVVVEADDDLAACIIRFFDDRFEVFRAPSLKKAADAVGERNAGILLADIDPGSSEEVSVIKRIRREHPDIRIVLTYLTPPASELWEEEVGESADAIVRKPYGLLDVDGVISAWEQGRAGQP